MAIDFGLSVPAGPPAGQTARWLRDLDVIVPRLAGYFRGLWMTDHFFWEEAPTYEAWTVLSVLADRYPTFEIGPIVLGQGYRNPALMAKMAATLQALSGGRFVMGIGAGWKEDEYHAYGYPYPRPGIRVSQLEDTLEIFKRLWTQPGKVSYQGKHYHIKDAYCEPKPDPVPPLLVGGGGDRTTLLAARFADWWNIPDAGWPKYSDRLRVVREHCVTIGATRPACARRGSGGWRWASPRRKRGSVAGAGRRTTPSSARRTRSWRRWPPSSGPEWTTSWWRFRS
jgi:hypothetical protein